MKNIYIGFDQVESVAWHTMVHSILSRSSIPVGIVPLKQSTLQSIYKRERNNKQSNEFSFTRFLVPYLNDYTGWAIFFDCDMLVRADIKELFSIADLPENRNKAILVVKHDYTPSTQEKYLGATQYIYPRKNWSSVILWNCAHEANRIVTPEYVNTAAPMELHQFKWLQDEDIGNLPVTWNWLVDEYPLGMGGIEKDDIKNWHWTIGGPYFDEYRNVDGAEDWFNEHSSVNHCLQKERLNDI